MGRRLAALAVLSTVAACPGHAPPSPTVSTSGTHPWPMFRGSATHVGDYSDRPTPAWKTRWSVELGERIDASAVITNRNKAIVATRKGTVVILDMKSGREVRRAKVTGGVWSSPALVGDVLVLATDASRIVALHARSLRPLWHKKLPSGAVSGLAVAGATVYLCSGKHVLGFDAATGAATLDFTLGDVSFTTPAIDPARDLLVVGARNGDIVALSLRGRQKWRAATSPGANNDGSAVIAGERVLIGSNDKALHAFTAGSGTKLWAATSGNWVVSTAAVVAGVVYTGDDGGRLRALSVTDGSESWSVTAGDDVASSPTVVGALIVHGAHDSKLHAYTLTGEALESIDVGSPAYASVAVAANGAMVIGTHAGRVIAIE